MSVLEDAVDDEVEDVAPDVPEVEVAEPSGFVDPFAIALSLLNSRCVNSSL